VDFRLSPAEEAFRQEFSDWLDTHLPRDFDPERFEFGLTAEQRFAWQLAWHQTLHAGGWVGIHWPREYGGRGASLMEQVIFMDELAKRHCPAGVNQLGILLVGPTLMHWGSEAQKQRFIPKILSAEEIWCQGYSEPGAGSDLASLQTRAVLEGSDFIVNGQKVWTSGAHHAHWCILLVRTEPSAPKHRGISYLVVDMKTPGITVRPLVQMTGSAGFSEVFFEEVRVPRANLVGELNHGWDVAMTTLMFERAGLGSDLRFEGAIDALITTARQLRLNGRPALEDGGVRQQIAQFTAEAMAIKLSGYRQLTKRLRGLPPGPEGSLAKLCSSELNLRITQYALALLGPHAQIDTNQPGELPGHWLGRALLARAHTIAGGTSEIQRNILAERVLGLPRSA
jgi:alkylation response protein AidB-like acyl-CoA dehydrogenase